VNEQPRIADLTSKLMTEIVTEKIVYPSDKFLLSNERVVSLD